MCIQRFCTVYSNSYNCSIMTASRRKELDAQLVHGKRAKCIGGLISVLFWPTAI